MAATSDHPQRRPHRTNGNGKPRSNGNSNYRQQPRHLQFISDDIEVLTDDPEQLPQDVRAEEGLIDSVIQEPGILSDLTFIKPIYFFRAQHQVQWQTMQEMRAAGHAIDHITLLDALRTNGKLADAGGEMAIYELGNRIPHSGFASEYARIICEKYLSRCSLRFTGALAPVSTRGEPGEIIAAWSAQHAEIQELAAALNITAAGSTARFAFMTDEEVEAMPDPDWLIHNILVENTVSVAYGDYGSGKSFLALDWALSIATGFPWMGELVKRGLVAYIAGEGIGGMKRRIRAWKKYHHWTSGPTGVHLLGTAPQLLQPEDVQALLVSLRGLPDTPVLVVIDTLSRSMSGGEENLQRDMSIAVAAAEVIRAEFGCHVLIVHHKPSGASKTRGSTVLPGAAQTLIDVSKDGNVMTISCPKQKDHQAFLPLRYRLHSVVLDEHDAQNNSLVLVPITAYDGEDASGPVKLTKAAENVLEILRKSPGRAAQFMTIVNAMAAYPYRMAKSTTNNALHVLEDARMVENTGTLWQLLE